ncbi:MAG: arsenosugar biosynthesis radical SAM protein ArsS [Nitrospirae bacterium]|nr:arsenosugar biosynthesis radical SAM protein ArsS [Nitrospirota bacterium]
MNAFEKKISTIDAYPLKAENISTLQVNLGYKCNLRCAHCHVGASPDRKEEMSSATVDRLLDILRENDTITTVDITGGSPELNPNYRRFIKSAVDMGKKVMVRSNLAILTDPEMKDIPEFLAQNRVKIIASLPCYTAEGVNGQRGKGTYEKAIAVLKSLNKLGYGQEGTGLEIDIMFNPAKAEIAPDQNMLESTYKNKLGEMHGITFNHLIALSNMPIGRLGKTMSSTDKEAYLKQLEEKFNPATVKNVMCRSLISVSPDGTLYDCDFWQMLKLPVKNRNSNTVNSFDYSSLSNRDIVTGPLCFMCTAGAGASCSGSLV